MVARQNEAAMKITFGTAPESMGHFENPNIIVSVYAPWEFPKCKCWSHLRAEYPSGLANANLPSSIGNPLIIPEQFNSIGNISSFCATWEPRLLSCQAMTSVPIAVFWKTRHWFWMR